MLKVFAKKIKRMNLIQLFTPNATKTDPKITITFYVKVNSFTFKLKIQHIFLLEFQSLTSLVFPLFFKIEDV
jgi:hypothetical protein